MNQVPAPVAAPTSAIRLRDWLADQRVVISTLLFVVLIVEDVWRGRRPHSWRSGEVEGTVGLVLVIAGLAVRSWAAGVLQKGRQLAETGPYSLCRHPLYFGSALMMFGFCLLVGDWWNWLYICGPVAVIYGLTIAREERRIASQYPEPWPGYAARVPRIFPWRPDRYRGAEWSAALWRRNREYKAVLGSLAGLAAIEFIRRI